MLKRLLSFVLVTFWLLFLIIPIFVVAEGPAEDIIEESTCECEPIAEAVPDQIEEPNNLETINNEQENTEEPIVDETVVVDDSLRASENEDEQVEEVVIELAEEHIFTIRVYAENEIDCAYEKEDCKSTENLKVFAAYNIKWDTEEAKEVTIKVVDSDLTVKSKMILLHNDEELNYNKIENGFSFKTSSPGQYVMAKRIDKIEENNEDVLPSEDIEVIEFELEEDEQHDDIVSDSEQIVNESEDAQVLPDENIDDIETSEIDTDIEQNDINEEDEIPEEEVTDDNAIVENVELQEELPALDSLMLMPMFAMAMPELVTIEDTPTPLGAAPSSTITITKTWSGDSISDRSIPVVHFDTVAPSVKSTVTTIDSSSWSSARSSFAGSVVTFTRSNVATPPTGATRVDDGATDKTVYVWQDGSTTYWWSNADVVYFPANSSSFFYNCTKMTTCNLAGFNTSKMTNAEAMFRGCSSLVTLDISMFDTSNLTNSRYMFRGMTSLTTIYASTRFVTSKITTYNLMYASDSKLVGQNGTKFSVTHLDPRSYSQIDKSGQSGYFTEKAYSGSSTWNEKYLGGNVSGEVTQSEMYHGLYPNEIYEKWVDNGDGTWTYRKPVTNFGQTIYVWEETVDGYESVLTWSTIEVSAGQNYSVGFTNTKISAYTPTVKTGNLYIEKQLSGTELEAGDYDQYFDITIELDGVGNTTISDIAFTNGVATIQLKGGEALTLSGISAGTKFNVYETVYPEYVTTYNGEMSTGVSGLIVRGTTQFVTIMNSKSSLTTGTINFITINNAPLTGVSMDIVDSNDVVVLSNDPTLSSVTINGELNQNETYTMKFRSVPNKYYTMADITISFDSTNVMYINGTATTDNTINVGFCMKATLPATGSASAIIISFIGIFVISTALVLKRKYFME